MDKDNRLIVIPLVKEWKFKQKEETKWLSAVVPGCFHTDLMRNGIISDPSYRDNEKEIQWLDKKDWIYKLDFKLDKSILLKENIELVFEGLDTYSTIKLNGNILSKTDNMFRSWHFNIKEFLKEKNELEIIFHSPIKEILPKIKELGFNFPADNDASKTGGIGDSKVSVFTRKAPYHFGGNWGPRIVSSGIWRPVSIKAWDTARINDAFVKTLKLKKGKASIEAIIDFEIADNGVFWVDFITDDTKKTVKVTSRKGKNTVKIIQQILKPKLWWCNGLGLPYLYSARIVLRKDDEVIDEKSFNFGIRTITLCREKDEWGMPFSFLLNDKPVFMKGANHIPGSMFPSELSEDSYHSEINSAALAHMNMIRVWGGGIYENDLFYEYCDKAGILVWQDFMFACSMYPGDEEFLDNVQHEAEDNIKRIRRHPCLALWCGNNEIDIAWQQNNEEGGWGWKQRYNTVERKILWEAYQKIFLVILPQMVKKLNPEISYHSSSPSILLDMGHSQPHSNTATTSSNGEVIPLRSTHPAPSPSDMHYWGVWHLNEPFDNYNHVKSRFMSEYGFQSFPGMRTIEKFTLPEDRSMDSSVMLFHQKNGAGNRIIKKYMDNHYKEPRNFEAFVYLSQVLQAEGLKIAIESHRRQKPYCMGTLFWQLNDCYPAPSWSSIDSSQRWKALHYFVKKAYREMMIIPLITDGFLGVSIVSDRMVPAALNLVMGIMDFNGHLYWESRHIVEITENSSELVFIDQLEHLIPNLKEGSMVIFTRLEYETQIITDNLCYFKEVKDLKLPQPDIRTKWKKIDKGYQLELLSLVLVKNLFIETGLSVDFISDNYFDMLPGEVYKVQIFTNESLQEQDLRLRSMVDFC